MSAGLKLLGSTGRILGKRSIMAAAAVTAPPRHDVHTTMNFFKPNEDGSPPSPAYMARPETFERPPEVHNVLIQDVTGSEDKYSLEREGFQFVSHVSAEKDFVDQDRVKDVYYKEIDELLKKLTGASRTHIFDHTIRKPNQIIQDHAKNDNGVVSHDDEKPFPGPTHSVHVDQSYESALSRVTHHLPSSDVPKLLKGRVQLINLWRPIKTVRRDPLAVSDSHTVPEEDLIPIPVVYPKGDRTGATLSVKHRDSNQWFYKHHQTPEEVLVFKCFDNRAGVQSAEKYKDRAKRVPHSAFAIPGTEGEEARESIEVRALVFHEDDVE